MLKSSVPVFFPLAFVLALPTNANPGQPVNLPVEPDVHSSSLTTQKVVAFSSPQEQEMHFVNAYIRENDEDLSAVKQRSKRPFRIIESVLQRYGLPVELKYLAVIESDLKATAVSRVGAKGPWQLMASTAHDLGLKVDSTADERTNYYKSTKAAALYLRDLHNTFKDWLLVLAAYNAGPLPVFRAIRRSGSTDFRLLARYLPAESRQHVRRFLATAYYFDVMDGGRQVAQQATVRPRGAAVAKVVTMTPATRMNANVAIVPLSEVAVSEVNNQVGERAFPARQALFGMLQRRRDGLIQPAL